MPVIIQWNFEDGSSEVEYISAYVWRKNEYRFVKTFMKEKKVSSITLDPYRETADINTSNQSWPSKEEPTRFDLYKAKVIPRGQNNELNPMQKSRK